MVTDSLQITELDELRKNYVYKTLCDSEQLELGAFQITERILTRGQQPCGIFFCLHGPRAVVATAIWESERNTILFYDSKGERFLKTQLTATADLASELTK